jgi:DNA-binding Xre family transcriptional regulator
MIKNKLQFGVSQTQAGRFETALIAARAKDVPAGTHPRMWQAYLDGMESQLVTLRREIADYQALSSGAVENIYVDSLEELPLGLIKARIARGLTHRQLADRLKVKAQQIQRWENDDYGSVSFNRLVEIANALEVGVSECISFRQARGVTQPPCAASARTGAPAQPGPL